jgi:hypothetical protein
MPSNEPPTTSNPNPDPYIYTLDPHRTEGADALASNDTPGITKIILREVEVTFDNALHDTTIRRSDNLLDPTLADPPLPNPIPPAGTLTQAALDIHLDGDTSPHRVRIRPPHSLKLNPSRNPKLLLSWLEKRGFRTLKHLAQSLAILALALASALVPDTDLDDDDDGPDPDHPSLPC